MQNKVRILFELGALLYPVVIVAILGADLLLGSRWPPIALLRTFTPFLFIPAIALLPVAILVRSRLAIVGASGLVVLFLVIYGGLFMPQRMTAGSENQLPIRVLTINLDLVRSDPEELSAVILAESADLVIVQELAWPASEILIESLTDYPETVWRPADHSIGLLSRIPIVSQEWIEVTGGRAVLHAELSWHAQTIQIMAVHASPPEFIWSQGLPITVPIGIDYREPSELAIAITDRMLSSQGPQILAGDFNLSDQTAAYRAIERNYVDAFVAGGFGFGFTYPNKPPRSLPIGVKTPIVRLDYIFHSSEFITQSAKTNCQTGSEHCLLVAELTLAAPQP